MNIFDKIEEIRSKPEHVRLRWAWGLTAVFMVGIIFLWLIILKSQSFNFSQKFPESNSDFSVNFNEQKKSLKDAVGQLKNAVNDPSQQADTPSAQNNPDNNSTEGFGTVSSNNATQN